MKSLMMFLLEEKKAIIISGNHSSAPWCGVKEKGRGGNVKGMTRRQNMCCKSRSFGIILRNGVRMFRNT